MKNWIQQILFPVYFIEFPFNVKLLGSPRLVMVLLLILIFPTNLILIFDMKLRYRNLISKEIGTKIILR